VDDLDIAPGEKHDLKSELRRRATLNEPVKTGSRAALPMKSLVSDLIQLQPGG